MKLLPLVILILVVSALLPGCGSGKYDERLLKAEELMDNRPDSSLHILDSLNPAALRQERDKVLYALLLTMAQDKNQMKPQNDSLIASAVEYFEDNKDETRLARAYHYQGRVKQLKGDYSAALLSFYKAKMAALNTDQYLIAGLACRGMSDIYGYSNNYPDEVMFAEKEYEYTLKSGRQPYINYAMGDLLRALVRKGMNLSDDHFRRANILADQLIDSTQSAGDKLLLHYSLQTKARALVTQGQYEEVEKVLNQALATTYGDTDDTLLLAWSAAMSDKLEDARVLVNNVDSTRNPILTYRTKSLIYNKLELYKAAQNERDLEDRFNYVESRKKLILPLSNDLANWFEMERQLDNQRIRKARFKLWIFVGIASFVILFLVSIIIIYRLRKKRLLDKRLIWIEELKSELDRKNEEKSVANQFLEQLMQERYSLIQTIGDINVQFDEKNLSRKKIISLIDRLMTDMSQRSSEIEKMERLADKIHDNLFTDFKTDLPDLREVDYRFFLFSIYGFKNQVMALFLNERNVDAVYNRRQRLRRKIRSLSPEKAERYLKYC